MATTRDRPGAQQRKGDRRVDERDQRRQSVHAEHTRHLRDGQHRDLAVAQGYPRKAAEQDAAEILGRDPGHRKKEQRRPADACEMSLAITIAVIAG